MFEQLVRSLTPAELRKRDWSGPVPALGDPDALGFILAATGRVPAASFGAQAPVDIYAA